ncbi:MAG: phoR [Bacteriovoracaceae bacterium]|nr:phoR [Bacteriovoracaceae bacterium]
MLSVALVVVALLAVLLFIKYGLLQKELLNKNQQIEALKRQGSDFVANVSHELKTPLTSIKGYTETLRSVITRDPEKAIEFLTKIEENSERLSLLITDILELSRIEQPNFYLEKHSFKVSPLLEEIKERFTYALSSRKQVLTIQCQVESIRGDRWLIDQAISNLVENSHRYSPEEAVIEISVTNTNENGKPYIQFQVSDNGPGIKPGDIPRIFERFYRADKSRNRLSGGTGLGLAIAKHIMLSHNGHIRVESELGRGAHFFLLFPK